MKSYKKNIKSRKSKLSRKAKKVGGAKEENINDLMVELKQLNKEIEQLIEKWNALNDAKNTNRADAVSDVIEKLYARVTDINKIIKDLKYKKNYRN